MKAILIIGLVAGVILLGGATFYLVNSSSSENFCQAYDGNQQKCLSHPKCEWSSDRNTCDSKDIDEEDEDDEGLNRELEAIKVPNNPSNRLCKKTPLSNQPPYNERYRCLALVNHDERFCEGMDEEKEKIMCLAFTKKDSSYCKKIKDQDSKRVCYLQLSVSSKNADFCSDIDYSQHEKEQCYFNFMSNLYQWGKSDKIKTEYCSQLGPPGNEMRNTCLALKANNISMCGDNHNCLTFFEQPLSFCDDRPDYSSCIKDRAKTSKNVSICELLPQPDRDKCVGSYCTHTELNVKICDSIKDINERQDRYLELAMNLANW